MKIRYKVSMAGPGVQIGAGHEADVEDAQAKRLIKAGYAEPLRPAPKPKRHKVQKATDEAPERAVERE